MIDNSKFVLQESVRTYFNGKTEYRLRKGIWNYEEAEIDIASFSEAFHAFFGNMIDDLCSEDGFSVSKIDDSKLNLEEKETIKSLLSQLEAGSYLLDLANRDLNRELSYALLGYSLVDDRGGNGNMEEPSILVFTDSEHAKNNARSLASTMKLKLTFASEADFEHLSNCDLTTKTDGLSTEDEMAECHEKYGSYKVFLICLQNLSAKFMRNLNRLSVEYHIPMVIAFIDGPMISVLSVKSPDTGCYECFENRSLARIQDHVLFHQFEQSARSRKMVHNSCLVPVMNFLINICLAECYLFAYYGASRFEGRLLSVFIPTLEIQVQDVLRVPFCPACGIVAKEQLKEKNISTRALIDHFVDNAILKKINK